MPNFLLMNPDKVKEYFSQSSVVCDYARAVFDVGLWESEKILALEHIEKSFRILELGCGAGRISLGLWGLGYRDICATDFSPTMVEVAKNIFEGAGAGIKTRVADATDLPFEDGSFDAAIFGFNGLMQIPLRGRRKRAISEISRVLRKGAPFIFTTHDRDNPANSQYWQDETKLWREHKNNQKLDEFGDICYESGHGEIFIHSPTKEAVDEDINGANFAKIFEKKRSEIAFEKASVKDFSDDCIFRVCLKK